jgi:hypothetical protein
MRCEQHARCKSGQPGAARRDQSSVSHRDGVLVDVHEDSVTVGDVAEQ